jgi:hypothetical protein
MPRIEIVIDLENRIVGVYASQPDDLDVILVDWDNEGVDPRSLNMVDLPCRDGRRSVFVLSVPVLPLHELAGSASEQAIDIAEAQGALGERVGVIC